MRITFNNSLHVDSLGRTTPEIPFPRSLWKNFPIAPNQSFPSPSFERFASEKM
jgi:hypothetical protein